MSTEIIRGKLHAFLELADDKKVEAIYTLMEDEINSAVPFYSDELKAELRKRKDAYQNGTEKTLSSAESKKKIQDMLNRDR